jgi:hypothetical protein
LIIDKNLIIFLYSASGGGSGGGGGGAPNAEFYAGNAYSQYSAYYGNAYATAQEGIVSK